jgi:hypothetical protein
MNYGFVAIAHAPMLRLMRPVMHRCWDNVCPFTSNQPPATLRELVERRACLSRHQRRGVVSKPAHILFIVNHEVVTRHHSQVGSRNLWHLCIAQGVLSRPARLVFNLNPFLP